MRTIQKNRYGEPIVAVYPPRRPGAGAWLILAAVVLAVLIGGTNAKSGGSGAGSPGSSGGATVATAPAVPSDSGTGAPQDGMSADAKVKASGGLPVHAAAGVSAPTVGRLAANSTVAAECYLEGPAVIGWARSANPLWIRVTVGGVAGYVPDAWLETPSDITTLVRPCQ
jgi:hypothetical protein